MITFKAFLAEARAAPLYHATTMDSAESILRTNEITGSRAHAWHLEKERVSLTRSLDTARRWRSAGVFGVIFELDQQKLTHRYKIKPIEIEYLWAMGFDEKQHKAVNYRPKSSGLFEEYISGKISDIDKYIVKIIIKDVSAIDNSMSRHQLGRIRNHPKLYSADAKAFINK